MRRPSASLLVSLLALAGCRAPLPLPAGGPVAGWPAYGGDPGGARYSPLTEITPANVARLAVAWTYHTGDVPTKEQGSAFETTPILADGTLYLTTHLNRVIALDAESGAERWTYDPKIASIARYSDFVSRGVSTWLDAGLPPGSTCRRRIFVATNDARLVALDAANGKLCEDFGERGIVDLSSGVGRHERWEYGVSSPPAIADDLVIVGSKIADNQRTDAPSGVVRAFDARSGRLRWAWNPVSPGASSEDGDHFRLGTANTWGVISVDAERHLVFVPTGNAAPDFYGGERHGSDFWSSAVVALHAAAGEVAWRFQTVHHDLWDYDVPAEPALIRLRRGGGAVDAVAQITKVGHLFVLDREHGTPLFPVEERAVPASDAAGETAAATQPVPVRPPPLSARTLHPEDAWGITPWDRGRCRERIAALRSEGPFTPPSTRGTIIFPGNVGGGNWSGVAFDPERQLLVVNVNNAPFVVTLVPRDRFEAERAAHPDVEYGPQAGTPFGIRREVLLSPFGLPCNPPPWGELVGVDLASGEIRWKVPFGTTRDFLPVPLAIRIGTPSLGGAIATASGLVFIGAAMDNYLRAIDIETGKELWKGRLPAGGQATPMTYRLRPDGRQFVVIAAGGHARLGTRLGDAVVAFALR